MNILFPIAGLGTRFKKNGYIEYGYEPVGPFSPTISQDNINLSLAFFEQMDGLGDTARKDLEAKL